MGVSLEGICKAKRKRCECTTKIIASLKLLPDLTYKLLGMKGQTPRQGDWKLHLLISPSSRLTHAKN
jgi:hypothetical protein